MRLSAAALLAFFAATPAAAIPDRPITMVLPYSPGSAADAYARLSVTTWRASSARTWW